MNEAIFTVTLRTKSGFTASDVGEIREYVKYAIETDQGRLHPESLMFDNIRKVLITRHKPHKVKEETVLLQSILQMHDYGHHPIKEHHANMARNFLKLSNIGK